MPRGTCGVDGENTADELAPYLVCSSLVNCMNVHPDDSLGEHLMDFPGEINVTGKASLEAELIVKILE